MKPRFSKVDWIVFAVVVTILLIGLLTACERKLPAAPPIPAPPVVAADMPTDTAGRILWLAGELAKAKAQQALERADNLRKITEAQITWATWAAGAAFLLGAVMLGLSFTLGIPKRFGAIGMVLGASLLIAARVWSAFAAWAPLAGILAIVGGGAVLLYILYKNRAAIKAKIG